MIRHIVAFKLKDYPTKEEKLQAAETVKAELLTLPSKISVICDFEVGINISNGPSAYDLIINSTFNNSEDLKTYQVHPDHQAFIAFNKNFSVHKAIVDYEF
jgi:hypothetical protein